MSKQGQALKDVSGTAMHRWNVGSARGVKQESIAKRDRSTVRRGQSGKAIEQRSFACARRAEKDGKTRRHFEFDVEEEVAMTRSEQGFEIREHVRDTLKRNRTRFLGYLGSRGNVSHGVLF